MDSCLIGIIGCGLQGKSIALWLAKAGMQTLIYDIDPVPLEKFRQELAPENRKNSYIKQYLSLAGELREMQNCDVIIENIPEALALKQQCFLKLELITKHTTILASNTSTFTPSEICRVLETRNRFINLHFLGVPWAGSRVEIIPGKETSAETVTFAVHLLKQTNFIPVLIGECPGFVYNRIKLAEVSNLFRAIESGMVPLREGLHYKLFPGIRYPLGFIDFMGIEVSEASIRSLNAHYGARFYPSQVLAEKVKKHELGKKTGKGFYDHSQPVLLEYPGTRYVKSVSDIKTIYIPEIEASHGSLLLLMLHKGKKVYFKNEDAPFLRITKKINPAFYARLIAQCCFLDQEERPDFDLIFFSTVDSFENLVMKINNLQEEFAFPIPVAVNSPIYKIAEIAARVKYPAQIAGTHYQKNYLENIELIKTPLVLEKVYTRIRSLVGELAGDYIEIADNNTRPLILCLIPKMLEAVRIIEEGITDINNIDLLLEQDSVIKDIDYLGLDNLITITHYLAAACKLPFEVPALAYRMAENKKLGIKTGKGFYKYYQDNQ